MKRLLGLVAILSGLTWGVLFGRAVQGRESKATRDARTAAFVLMIAAGSLYPIRKDKDGDDETL